MPDLLTLLYFLGTSVVLTVAPGPDILYVLAQSITSGTRAGIITALGLCSGLVIHISLAASGAALTIKNSPFAFSVIHFAGVFYLLYLAYQTLRETDLTFSEVRREPALRLYLQGFYMSSLNPKLILFFLALFPQFIEPKKESVLIATVMLGAIFMIQAFLIFTAVALFASALSKNLRNEKFIKSMNVAKALFLFVLAISLLFFKRDILLS